MNSLILIFQKHCLQINIGLLTLTGLNIINHDISSVGFFPTGKIYIEKIIKKRQILAQPIRKSFLIDSLTTNNPILGDSLTLSILDGNTMTLAGMLDFGLFA